MKCAVVFAVLALSLLDAGAARAACAPYSNAITVDFESRLPRVGYNNTLNVTGIRNLSASKGLPVAGPHTQALGVTYASPMFGLEGHTRSESTNGGYCVYLTEVAVDFGFRDMDVYVASEYPPGSCEYKTILDHENQHVAINTQTLREMAPRVRAQLEQLLAAQRPVFTTDTKGTTRTLLGNLSGQMESALTAFENVLSTRNGEIDTDRNYKATSDVCRDWDRGNVWSATPNKTIR